MYPDKSLRFLLHILSNAYKEAKLILEKVNEQLFSFLSRKKKNGLNTLTVQSFISIWLDTHLNHLLRKKFLLLQYNLSLELQLKTFENLITMWEQRFSRWSLINSKNWNQLHRCYKVFFFFLKQESQCCLLNQVMSHIMVLSLIINQG